MNISTLRPGLLVSLKTSLLGNVTYATREIEADHLEDDGSRQAQWETTRVIEHPGEYESGVKTRAKCRSLISAVCSPSSFGLLCPEQDRDKLDAAIAEARTLASEFNATAQVTQVAVYVIVGRVASDDVEAVRAINGEIRDLMTEMETGLQRLDVDAVRAAANKARSLGSMLSPAAADRVTKAIEAARSAARRIVKAGEVAASEIDEATLARIREARTAFLDLDDAADVQEPVQTGRAIDLDLDEAPAAIIAPPAPRVSLELLEGEL